MSQTLRQRIALKTARRRVFCDPSLAADRQQLLQLRRALPTAYRLIQACRIALLAIVLAGLIIVSC